METRFNKHQFIEDLMADIINETKKSNIQSIEDYYQFVEQSIDNECIYYSDCFDICKELNAIDFGAYGVDCENITQLAYACLSEFVDESIDVDFVDDLIKQPKA